MTVGPGAAILGGLVWKASTAWNSTTTSKYQSEVNIYFVFLHPEPFQINSLAPPNRYHWIRHSNSNTNPRTTSELCSNILRPSILRSIASLHTYSVMSSPSGSNGVADTSPYQKLNDRSESPIKANLRANQVYERRESRKSAFVNDAVANTKKSKVTAQASEYDFAQAGKPALDGMVTVKEIKTPELSKEEKPKSIRRGSRIGDFVAGALMGYVPKERAPAFETTEPKHLILWFKVGGNVGEGRKFSW